MTGASPEENRALLQGRLTPSMGRAGARRRPWLGYWYYLTALGAKADADGRRALEALQVSVYDLGSNLSGIELLDARAALLDALNHLDRKCIASGSAALH